MSNQNLNKENTIFVVCAASNDKCGYLEAYYNAQALNIPILNIGTEDLSKIEKYDNVIFYNFPFVYFGGVVNEEEKKSIYFLKYCYENHKNLIVYTDITFKRIGQYKRGLKLLGESEFDIPYKSMSHEDFPFTVSRTFCDIAPMKENPTMGIFYGVANRKGRLDKLNEYVYKGNSDFYVCGPGCYKLRPKDRDININFLKKVSVSYSKYMEYLNDSYCTIMIQDDSWKKTKSKVPSWRHFEAWTQNCICFIDNDMDPNHLWLNGDDWFYIHNYEELYSKYLQIKNNSNFRKEKLIKQIEIMSSIDKQKYTEDYWKYLNQLGDK